MKIKINLLATLLTITSILVVILIFTTKQNQKIVIVSNFTECVNAGFEVIKSDPLQCKTKNGAIFYEEVNQPMNPQENEGVYCTADAKLCPDGSAVGRDNNNNCEFLPCPY